MRGEGVGGWENKGKDMAVVVHFELTHCWSKERERVAVEGWGKS